MANSIVVVTQTGFGKSTSYGHIPELGIQGLDPSKTFVINIKGKPLPFRGWKNLYKPIPNVDVAPPTTGNYFVSSNAAQIIKVLNFINNSRTDIVNVIIDDFQYLMADEFMQNALKSGYDKFNKMAKNAYDVINTGISMRDNINFIILTHDEKGQDGTLKMKTIGKMLDEKVTLEGLFTTILYGHQSFDEKEKKVTKQFVTNFDGVYPAKSPVGMFKELYIPNDLGLVVKTIDEYNNGSTNSSTEETQL